MKSPVCPCKRDWKGWFLCSVHARNIELKFKEYGEEIIDRAVKVAKGKRRSYCVCKDPKLMDTCEHCGRNEACDQIAEEILKLKKEGE